MTRAACTYSLFFSTSVEPRTVRAYCTQFEMPIAKISTNSATLAVRVARQHRARDAVDQQRDQDRRKRQLDVGDAHDERRRSCRRRSRRSGRALTPSTIAKHHRREPDQQRNARAEHDRRQHVASLVVGAEQIAGLARPPCHAGGDSASSRLSVARSNGLCGATQGANSAPARQIASTAAETIATGERRKLYARSLSPARASRERRVAHARTVARCAGPRLHGRSPGPSAIAAESLDPGRRPRSSPDDAALRAGSTSASLHDGPLQLG